MSRHRFLNAKNFSSIVLITLCFYGCSLFDNNQYSYDPFNQSQNNDPDYQETIKNSFDPLAQVGISFLEVGNTITLRIPNSVLFNSYSANLNYQALGVMDDVVKFMSNFKYDFVNINTSYYDNERVPYISYISQHQADTIVNILSNLSDARLITSNITSLERTKIFNDYYAEYEGYTDIDYRTYK